MDFERAAEDFRTAAEELRRPVSYQDMAGECGVSVEDIQHAMLEEGSRAYLPPPRFWQGDLAYLARRRAAELVELADALEARAWAPATEEELEEIGSMILTKFDEIVQPADSLANVERQRVEREEHLAEIERRRVEREQYLADIERRHEERKRQQEEELAELNAMFARGLGKAP